MCGLPSTVPKSVSFPKVKAQALAAFDYYVEKNIDWTDAFMATQLIAKGIH